MAWDFSTEPEFQVKLDWARQFVTDKVEPLDLLYPHRQFHPLDDELRPIVDPMKQEVRDHGLWAAHLGPELGGKGYGQLKLALLNEILGVSSWAPIVFGTQAPDTGNAEIIAHYGTEEQKESYLQPLLNGECFSCYSMTEPQAGSDPQQFTTQAVRDGDEWVINGWKFFSSNARTASFLIVMAITDPDVSVYKGASMFLVPTDTPGVDIVRHIGPGRGVRGRGHARPHPLRRRPGPGRQPAGRRGPGLRHRPDPPRRRPGPPRHADRGHLPAGPRPAVRAGAEPRDPGEPAGPASSSSRATSPTPTPSSHQFRLLVLYTAWEIDQYEDYRRTRKNIAAIKALTPKVVHDAVWRSMHAHGALGVSNEMPFGGMWMMAPDHERGRRAHRGPQGHGGPRGAEGLRAVPGPVAHRPPAGQARGGPPEAGRPRSSTPSATPEHEPCGPPAASTTARPTSVVVEEVADPVAAEGQVVVDVAAAAVNFPDVLVVADRYQITIPVPFTVGSEFAGTVPLGRARRRARSAVGDRVMGSTLFGAFAEQVAVPADVAAAGRPGDRPGHGRGLRGGPPDRLPRPAQRGPGPAG